MTMSFQQLSVADCETRLGFRPFQFADAIGVSVNFVRKEINEGRLKARKIGDCVVILTEDATAYLKSQPEVETKNQKPLGKAA